MHKKTEKNWRGAGRNKDKHEYISIIKDGKIVMPKIVTHDIGWELLMGWEYVSKNKEAAFNAFSISKNTLDFLKSSKTCTISIV